MYEQRNSIISLNWNGSEDIQCNEYKNHYYILQKPWLIIFFLDAVIIIVNGSYGIH